jgi:peptide/nickel transport system permease protein
MTIMWWPWYCRLVYGQAAVLRNEPYVLAAEMAGAGRPHILLKEILPNCVSSVLTKMTLDMAIAILLGASLSFVGLGAQPPTPDLGTMVSAGSHFLPDFWWIGIFPALAIIMTVLGFNLLGDGLRDFFAIEELGLDEQ